MGRSETEPDAKRSIHLRTGTSTHFIGTGDIVSLKRHLYVKNVKVESLAKGYFYKKNMP